MLELPPAEERRFKQEFTGTPFYHEFVKKFGELPNPDDPNYDYRRAWKAGIQPEQNKVDGLYHWPDATSSGEWLKSPRHPTAWMNPFMKQYGINPDDLPKDDPRVVAYSKAWQERYPEKKPEATPGGDMGPWTKSAAEPYQSPKNWKEKRWNDLEVYNNPEAFIYVDHDKFKDYYSKNTIGDMVKAARKYGVDPYTYLAIGVAEGGLGNTDQFNPVRIADADVKGNADRRQVIRETAELPNLDSKEQEYLARLYREENIENGAEYLKLLTDRYGREKGIHAYNGLGKGATKDYTGRINSVVAALKKNPEIKKLVEEKN